jgi:ATP-binding cassette, subfamily B, bacterial
MAKILTMTETSYRPEVRKLVPDTTRLRRGQHDLLECEISGEGLYRGVTAVMLFPITHPDRWVSLRHTDETDREKEIGIIENLSEYEADDQSLIRQSLRKHYHETLVLAVYSILHKYGQLFFKVHTPLGIKEFVTPWRSDRAEDYGTNGKVILDALNNRFLIPDLEKLTAKERRLVSTYIYW